MPEEIKMSPDQEEHSQLMANITSQAMLKKYAVGTKEHSGKLWEVPGVIDMAFEEIVDLANYILTLKGQLRAVDEAFQEAMQSDNQEVTTAVSKIYKEFKLLVDKPKG